MRTYLNIHIMLKYKLTNYLGYSQKYWAYSSYTYTLLMIFIINNDIDYV